MPMLEEFLKSFTLIEYRRQELDRITELYLSIYFTQHMIRANLVTGQLYLFPNWYIVTHTLVYEDSSYSTYKERYDCPETSAERV